MHITIPLNPIPKKNSQRIVVSGGRKRLLPSTRFMTYQAACLKHLKPYIGKTIDTPVNIKCLFFRSTHIRCDMTNLLEAIDDVLVHYRIIDDDNFSVVAGHDGSRVYVDKDHPRTEIEITPMEEDSNVCP